MVAEIVWLGLVCILLPAIAQYAGTKRKLEKTFELITLSGLLFVLAGSFDVYTISFWMTGGLTEIAGWLMQIFEVFGWIFIAVGVILALYESFR
jgi:hypothetical protein